MADTAINDATALFAAATTSSTQNCVISAHHHSTAAAQDIHAADSLLSQAQHLIDAYCQTVAGHGINTSGPPVKSSPLVETNPAIYPDDPSKRYAEEIAEIRRTGAKISPEKVVRVGRHREGHRIWLEEGVEEFSGLAHILRDRRQDNFEGIGIARDQVIDIIFDQLENKTPYGYCGKDGAVYGIEVKDGVRRIAIVVGKNGYIVTAYPLNQSDKIRPHRLRR